MLGVDSLRPAPRREGNVVLTGTSTVLVERAPWPLVLAGLLIAGLALLPVGYLVVRALGADVAALDLVLRPRTLLVAASTLALASGKRITSRS